MQNHDVGEDQRSIEAVEEIGRAVAQVAATSASPVWPILLAAPPTLLAIAPERRGELLKELKGVHIELSDAERRNAFAYPNERRIVLTRGYVETLWCASYAYYAFRLAIEKATAERTGGRIEIPVDGTLGRALKALTTAVTAVVERKEIDWADLPTPVPPGPVTAESSLQAKAGEMTLVALGFVLHHELAHLRLGATVSPSEDRDPTWGCETEKDADSLAIEWILGAAPENDRANAKRLFGVVIATAFATACRLLTASRSALTPVEQQTHPQPYDRLDKAARHDAVQRSKLLSETVWSLCCHALVPNIRIAGIPLEDGPYDDYKELYDKCLDVLATRLVPPSR